MPQGKSGFTLMELLVVIAVLTILAGVLIPRYGTTLQRASEGKTKGNLGALRGALHIYYSDLEGQYPSDLSALTVSAKYVKGIPATKTPDYHNNSNAILNGDALTWTDVGGWHYNNVAGSTGYGSIWVNCTHTDSKSSIWSTY